MTRLTESTGEDAALAWLGSLGWQVAHGPDMSPAGDTLTPALSQRERENYGGVALSQRERENYGEVVLAWRLRVARSPAEW